MNKIKGDLYEQYIQQYTTNKLQYKSYLWKYVPEKYLINIGYIDTNNQMRAKRKYQLINQNNQSDQEINPFIDIGVDIVAKNQNQQYIFIQCKNGYQNGITIQHLSGFYMMMFNYEKLIGQVYYTSKLSHQITDNIKNNRIQYIKHPFNQNNEQLINQQINNQQIIPKQYQLDAQNKIKQHLQNNNKSYLQLPCGCGKTLIAYNVSNDYDIVILISPLKQFAQQNLDKFIEYGYKNQKLLIDSDGTRDKDIIIDFINNSNKFILSLTYKSVDILQQIIHLIENKQIIIIIDEFHNLSKNNILGNQQNNQQDNSQNIQLNNQQNNQQDELQNSQQDDFYLILNNQKLKFLFLSATPRIYELENDINDLQFDITYQMTINEAIQNKYICNYKLYLPQIDYDYTQFNQDIDNEIQLQIIDDQLKAKCQFLFKALIQNGNRKCIIYCQNKSDINNMITMMNDLNNYYCIEFKYNVIISDTNQINRQQYLEYFQNNNDYIQLLFSVRILDECIDIPKCDSIYITYNTQSKLRTIQRMFRCLRLDQNNSQKIGNIYIWCEQYDQLIESLSGIKEYDINFVDKVRILNSDMDFDKKIQKQLKDQQLIKIKNYIIGIQEYKYEKWENRLQQVKDYINQYGHRPQDNDNDINIRQLGKWLQNQQQYYKSKQYIMKNSQIYDQYQLFLQQYKQYFKSNDEQWYINLNKVKNYIDNYKKRPSAENKDPEIKQIGKWLEHQQNRYKKNEFIFQTNQNVYNEYTLFLQQYNEYFMTNQQLWYHTLNKVKNYIDINGKRPSAKNNDEQIAKLGDWIQHQQTNHNKKINIMKNEDIYNEFKNFKQQYQQLFK